MCLLSGPLHERKPHSPQIPLRWGDIPWAACHKPETSRTGMSCLWGPWWKVLMKLRKFKFIRWAPTGLTHPQSFSYLKYASLFCLQNIGSDLSKQVENQGCYGDQAPLLLMACAANMSPSSGGGQHFLMVPAALPLLPDSPHSTSPGTNPTNTLWPCPGGPTSHYLNSHGPFESQSGLKEHRDLSGPWSWGWFYWPCDISWHRQQALSQKKKPY